MRSRRLEDLLGGRLDVLRYKDVAELVGNADAAEGEDLDYKQAHYANEDKGKEELAKDVAAFANHVGGLLILGMAEAKGVPSKVMDVDLDDRYFRHIRQVIAANTAPPVPYEPIAVPNPDSPGNGFLLLAVPRSPLGPHAVTAPPTRQSKDVLRYPRRGGSGTDWLTETAVATSYRARFSAAAERDRRMTEVEEDLVAELADRTSPHIIVTLVPEMAGEMTVDSARFARYKDQLLGTEFYLGQGHRPFGDVAVGARRLIVQEGSNDLAARAELHRDGSAAIALPLHQFLSQVQGNQPDWQFVEPGEVVYQLLCALPFLASHARDRAAASGTAQVRVTLVGDMISHPTQRLNIDIFRPEPLPLSVDFLHPATGQPVLTSTQPCGFAHSEATVLLDDIADHGVGLPQATAALADELLHAYGLPENQLITREGHLNTGLFTTRNRGAVARWAAQHPLISTAE